MFLFRTIYPASMNDVFNYFVCILKFMVRFVWLVTLKACIECTLYSENTAAMFIG